MSYGSESRQGLILPGAGLTTPVVLSTVPATIPVLTALSPITVLRFAYLVSIAPVDGFLELNLMHLATYGANPATAKQMSYLLLPPGGAVGSVIYADVPMDPFAAAALTLDNHGDMDPGQQLVIVTEGGGFTAGEVMLLVEYIPRSVTLPNMTDVVSFF